MHGCWGWWQGGMTEDPRSPLGVMGVLVVWVTVMDSGIYMCDSSCSHTRYIRCASAIPTKAGFEKLHGDCGRTQWKTHLGACFWVCMVDHISVISKDVLRRIEKWIHCLVYWFSIGEALHGWGDGGSRVQPSSIIREYMGLIIQFLPPGGPSQVMPGWAPTQLSAHIWRVGQKWPAQVPYFYRW